mgnify:FL=1
MRKRLSKHGIQGNIKKRICYLESNTAVAPMPFAETLLGLINDEQELGAVCATEDFPTCSSTRCLPGLWPENTRERDTDSLSDSHI